MNLPFTKMQGLGNDFVVFNFVDQPQKLSNEQFAHIADRRFGIGCDQILIVEKSNRSDIDFKYRIVNSDGTEVGQCGNGARCLAKFVRQQGLTDKTSIRVATQTAEMQLKVNEDQTVTVNMGKVSFSPESVPFLPKQNTEKQRFTIDLDNYQSVEISVANIGNPHCLLLVDDIKTAPVDSIGKQLESHSQFPEKVNVGFMQMLAPDEINLRVFERGAGETLACGSGACAAVAMGHRLGLLCDHVTVHLTGGDLKVHLVDNEEIMMTGDAQFSFAGQINL